MTATLLIMSVCPANRPQSETVCDAEGRSIWKLSSAADKPANHPSDLEFGVGEPESRLARYSSSGRLAVQLPFGALYGNCGSLRGCTSKQKAVLQTRLRCFVLTGC